MTNSAEWRYTFPIQKAEERDGGLFITGLASGPEVDGQNERMDPAVIYKFADQINNKGVRFKEDRLVYRDAHAPDGVLRDLGWVNKAWVNDQTQLGVEVELDVANPAAVFLFKNITERGKKYGMSVAGDVFAAKDEFLSEVGKAVRTLKDVVLKEISNTTRPAWTPSFGSVISKALDEAVKADSTPQGENAVSDTDKELHQHVDESAGGNDQPAEEPATDTVTTPDAPPANDAPAEGAEKAGKKVSGATSAKLLEQYQAFGATLRELGVLEETEVKPAEKADSDDESVNNDKTEDNEPDPLVKSLAETVADLQKSQAELTAALTVALNRPISQVPPVMEKNDASDDSFEEVFKGLSPSERLRASMAAKTRGL